jgi:hypothetical protein
MSSINHNPTQRKANDDRRRSFSKQTKQPKIQVLTQASRIPRADICDRDDTFLVKVNTSIVRVVLRRISQRVVTNHMPFTIRLLNRLPSNDSPAKQSTSHKSCLRSYIVCTDTESVYILQAYISAGGLLTGTRR